MEKRKRRMKHKIMEMLLILGAVTLIPLTAWLVIRFNWYFLGYPLVYAVWAINYTSHHGFFRNIRTKEQIAFDNTHEFLGDDANGTQYYKNKLTNETEEY